MIMYNQLDNREMVKASPNDIHQNSIAKAQIIHKKTCLMALSNTFQSYYCDGQ